MIAGRQTHRQTRSSQYSALPTGGAVTTGGGAKIPVATHFRPHRTRMRTLVTGCSAWSVCSYVGLERTE